MLIEADRKTADSWKRGVPSARCRKSHATESQGLPIGKEIIGVEALETAVGALENVVGVDLAPSAPR